MNSLLIRCSHEHPGPGRRQRLGFGLTLVLLLLAGCAVRFVTPYDEVIDSGLGQYRESVNRFVEDMGDAGGTPSGTYEANKTKYNELGAKSDLLADRAELGSSGNACRLSRRLTDWIMARLPAVSAEIAPDKQSKSGDPSGCTHRMLVLVRENLDLLEKIHSTTDKCISKQDETKKVTCIRPASAVTALKITNQAIDAAWVVEIAKREGDAN